LADSDYENNGGDIENNNSSDSEQSENDFIDSDSNSWNKIEDDNFSFNSDKLMDGYSDFKIF
jgi:hypothetical protein